MKNIIIAMLWLSLIACREEETLSAQSTPLVGSWVLTEQKVGIGPPGVWEDVSNGSVLDLRANGTFAGIGSCSPRSYRSTQNSITFTFDCPSDTIDHRDELSYEITEFTQDHMIITPTTYICFEGCEYKYTRID